MHEVTARRCNSRVMSCGRCGNTAPRRRKTCLIPHRCQTPVSTHGQNRGLPRSDCAAATPSRGPRYLLVRCHSSAPSGLGAVVAEVLVVVSSAGLLTEAPRLPVGVHAPESVVALSWSQLHKLMRNRSINQRDCLTRSN